MPYCRSSNWLSTSNRHSMLAHRAAVIWLRGGQLETTIGLNCSESRSIVLHINRDLPLLKRHAIDRDDARDRIEFRPTIATDDQKHQQSETSNRDKLDPHGRNTFSRSQKNRRMSVIAL